jgi:hypothetical protein
LSGEKDNPGAPSPTSGNAFREDYLARALYEDRQTKRSLQRWAKPGSKDYKQLQKEIDAIDRKLSERSNAQTGAGKSANPQPPPVKRGGKKINPNITRRRDIVKRNPKLTPVGILQLWDSDIIPLPEKMKEAGNWEKAYKSKVYHHAVEALLYRDRQAAKNLKQN